MRVEATAYIQKCMKCMSHCPNTLHISRQWRENGPKAGFLRICTAYENEEGKQILKMMKTSTEYIIYY